MLKFSKDVNGTLYQVTTAGNSIRLYRNGVMHTQWNPSFPLKGSLWELFLLAAMMRSNCPIQHSLILGMGGGATVNLFDRYLQPQRQTALELDPCHIHLAKKYFQVECTGVKILQQDAIAWLAKQSSSRQFDVIVDDLFAETDGEPHRVTRYSASWYCKLIDHVSVDGVAIFNFADYAEWQQSSLKTVLKIMKQIVLVLLKHRQCQNIIVAVYKRAVTMAQMRENVLNSSARPLWNYVEQGSYSVKVLSGRRKLR